MEQKILNLISLGCAKNLVDSEILLGGLKRSNIMVTEDPEAMVEPFLRGTTGWLAPPLSPPPPWRGLTTIPEEKSKLETQK